MIWFSVKFDQNIEKEFYIYHLVINLRLDFKIEFRLLFVFLLGFLFLKIDSRL
jgi:hypothetical protein